MKRLRFETVAPVWHMIFRKSVSRFKKAAVSGMVRSLKIERHTKTIGVPGSGVHRTVKLKCRGRQCKHQIDEQRSRDKRKPIHLPCPSSGHRATSVIISYKNVVGLARRGWYLLWSSTSLIHASNSVGKAGRGVSRLFD